MLYNMTFDCVLTPQQLQSSVLKTKSKLFPAHEACRFLFLSVPVQQQLVKTGLQKCDCHGQVIRFPRLLHPHTLNFVLEVHAVSTQNSLN